MDISRRQMLKLSCASAVGFSWNLYSRNLSRNVFAEGVSPHDETFWKNIAALFDSDRSFINLENGYYGMMPEPIHQNYLENIVRVNRANSYYLRTTFKAEMEDIRKKLALVLGVLEEEIVFTRGGTEALQNLISGYNKLNHGDEVMYADLDYYSCQYACNSLRERRNVSLFTITIPEPASKQAVIDAYEQALNEHPRLKLFLLTHVNNRTGLVVPVKEIVEMARERGVDVIVDAAHSWGQLDFNIPDLNADFVGLSLHKWLHAPLGLGCIYIRKNKINDIDPCMGDEVYASSDIRSRVHSGTINYASFLTLPTALNFHLDLGAQTKEDRLRFLRNLWVQRARTNKSIEILTPDDKEMYCGITSFRIKGRTSSSDNQNIVNYLFKKYGIFTVQRTGSLQGDCIRVTPALFTSSDDIEKFSFALEDVARNFALMV